MSDSNKEFLMRQLVKLGDMLGSGMHLEPGGKWISSEYRKISNALGIKKSPRSRNAESIQEIDQKMQQRVAEVECPKCKAFLFSQTRSGSMTAVCLRCGIRCKLLQRCRAKQQDSQ